MSRPAFLVDQEIADALNQPEEPVYSRAEPEATPALAEAPAPPIDPPSSQPRLHALPAKNPDFVGREDDMAKIKAALAKGGAVIAALEGMGGIGKTAVGIEVANALRYCMLQKSLTFDLT